MNVEKYDNEVEVKEFEPNTNAYVTMSVVDKRLIILREIHDGTRRRGVDEVRLTPDEWKTLKSLDISEYMDDSDDDDDKEDSDDE